MRIREEANASIEIQRAKKFIGSSLEASIVVELDKKTYELAKQYDFAEICITSKADFKVNSNYKNNIKVETFKAKGEKCPICWKIFESSCERHKCPI